MAKSGENELYGVLVDLANFDPDLARPGDWLNYRVGLDRLAREANQAMGTTILNVANPRLLGDIEAEVRPIHVELRQLVRTYAAGPEASMFWPVPIAAEVSVIGSAPPRLQVTGTTRDTVLLVVVMLLLRSERRIAICPEDERLFVKVRRQQYCSRRCVNRANVRAYREALAEKARKKSKASRRRTR
jgi:hypothetical protein